MHRARQEVMPPVPATRQDIILEGEWTETCTGTNFLLHKDEELVIFSTDDNLRQLAQSSTIFMDGTFKSTPSLFDQLYTMHGIYREHVIPLVYCLLPDRKRTTYFRVFEILKRRLAELDLVLEPDTVISDFEKAIVATIRAHLPTSTHHGCLFHYSQAVWKNVMSKGLSDLYYRDPVVKVWIRKILALPFLPAQEIPPVFTQLERDEVSISWYFITFSIIFSIKCII